MTQITHRSILLTATVILFTGTAPAAETLVSVGSPPSPFSQNKQNEPAVAVDANHPAILAAGANDQLDMEDCNAGDPATCPFTAGVGASGIYFSFNGGASWIQPTYTGWTARHCVGAPGFTCTPEVGPIGTLPWYYENNLASHGDPGLAFGPKPDERGRFSWANGSRLYYANLASNFGTARSETGFKGFEAVAVSRTDDVVGAAAGDKNAWKPPVIVTRQNAALFSDKGQIWADNAASSPFFGNVYVCNAAFRSLSPTAAFPLPLFVNTSTDGGDTWTSKQVTEADSNLQRGARGGCTIRTDSQGTVYVFFSNHASYDNPGTGTHAMVQSFDGGKSWTRPQDLFAVTDTCFNVDPLTGDCVEDGVAGARVNLAMVPSIDIANGAPTGADATDEIVDTWVDGRLGLNNEKVMVAYSSNRGASWSTPVPVSTPGDRGLYAASAISPNGTDLYSVYNAFTTPYRTTTSESRSLLGVMLHADIGAGGEPGSWLTLHRGATGDPRGSSTNDLGSEFLGDYVYAVATRTFGFGVWTDARNAADCPIIDAWRESVRADISVPAPQPNVQCPAGFGNTDIYGAAFADPTP
jgi:hypothetical protein